ncbi:serum paraoxonase/arylesterase [Gautieria morchelliformis]|nr:serum paraoxonase/arylesterase [Gautieria morchelliformis]
MPSVLRVFTTLGAIVIAVFGIYYQLLLKDILIHAGYWRTPANLNNAHCTHVPELKACEKSVRHRASGILYFACSTPASRVHWEPSVGFLNASARSLTDYVATYDPATSKITRLKLTGFPSSVPLAVHGFDVVPSDTNPSELFVYLVNHRPAPEGTKKFFADSVIEVFKTAINSDKLVYVTTVEDPSVIITPNDVVGYGDGSFHFTNDNRSKHGIMRTVDIYLRLSSTSVGYCHIEHGCKLAASGLQAANGIARTDDGLYFVANSRFGELFVLESQDDHSLVLTDVVRTDMPMDNVSVGEDGMVYIAAFPIGHKYMSETARNPDIPCAAAVLRVSRNTDMGQFYGDKFKVEKIFEDDGKTVSVTTTAIWDYKQKTLYLTGVSSPHVTICKINNL